MASGVDIVLQCGTDWWMQFVVTDAAGAALAVTSPKMEIRRQSYPTPQPNSAGDLIYSSEGGSAAITITLPASNTVLASIASAVSKNVPIGQRGYWDAYATDPSGKIILLGSGSFVSSPNVAEL